MTQEIYRYVVDVQIHSRKPLDFSSIYDVANAVASDDCSAHWKVTVATRTTGRKLVWLRLATQEDLEFFGLDEKGNDKKESE